MGNFKGVHEYVCVFVCACTHVDTSVPFLCNEHGGKEARDLGYRFYVSLLGTQ